MRRSLDAIVNNKDFDSDIEVVISDNASTDETADLCKDFTRRYPNVKYYKNVENVNDRNFSLALDRATGRYVKLMNDNYILAEDGLGYLKGAIKGFLDSKPALFFTNSVLFNYEKTSVCYLEKFEDLIVHLSYYVTAISTFGAWREDWDKVKNRDNYSELKLCQDDWAYQIMEYKGKGVLCTCEYARSIDLEGKQRSGYNWFKIHVENYYTILQHYISKGLVSKKALSKEKNTYLKGLHSQTVQALLYNPLPEWQFDMSGAGRILWRYYKKEPFFYLYMITLPLWGSLWIIKQYFRR